MTSGKRTVSVATTTGMLVSTVISVDVVVSRHTHTSIIAHPVASTYVLLARTINLKLVRCQYTLLSVLKNLIKWIVFTQELSLQCPATIITL